MQKTTSQAKIHQKNINLLKASNRTGVTGEKHSRVIDRLAEEIEAGMREMAGLRERGAETMTEKERELLKRIQDYEREECNLKKEMIRMSEMAKSYKNAKIEIEIKNQTLLAECTKARRENEEMKIKLDLLTQLNAMLMKIAENSLQIIPHYTNDCDDLFACMERVKGELSDGGGASAVAELRKKLESFRVEMDNIQSFNKRLIVGLAEAQQDTKSIGQRISLLNDLNIDDLLSLKNDLIQLNENTSFEEGNSSSLDISPPSLALFSRTIEHTIPPPSVTKMNKILQQICLLFQQHIHLLQTQKMEYQFTKNKKLITAQKYECDICENYEKIVCQIFSIVREAFKEIKFQFLREIKQIDDISEIPFLI